MSRLQRVSVRLGLVVAATAALALSPTGQKLAFALPDDDPSSLSQGDVKKVQKDLSDKGLYHGSVDGILGPATREAIREYQKSENLPSTGRLDEKTAGKLGVGPESAGGNFKGAGEETREGAEEAGHETKKGKPVAAGKEFGKGVGRAAKKAGKGVKKAVTPESDRGEREKRDQGTQPQ